MDVYDYVNSSKALTVIEESEVSEILEESIQIYPHAGDMFQAALWRIAREPDCGALIEDKPPFRRLIKLVSVKQSKNPVLLIRYHFDDKEAVVDWVKFLPYDDKQAVNPPAYIFKRSSMVAV